MTTITEADPIHFDKQARTDQLERLREAVAKAEADRGATAAARQEAEEALTATLANPKSSTAIRDARDDLEFTEIQDGKAERILIGSRAELDALSTDDDSAAVALEPFARALVRNHQRFTVITGAGELNREPDPTIGDPVITVRQLTDSERLPYGALRAVMEFSYYFDAGLHRDDVLTREKVGEALDATPSVWLADPRGLERSTLREGQCVHRLELELYVVPAVPTVTAEPDPQGLAELVAKHLEERAEYWGRRVRAVGQSGAILSERTEDGVITRTVEVIIDVRQDLYGDRRPLLAVIPETGDQLTSLGDLIKLWLPSLAGGVTGTLGRIESVELTHLGRPYVTQGGPQFEAVKVRVTTVAGTA